MIPRNTVILHRFGIGCGDVDGEGLLSIVFQGFMSQFRRPSIMTLIHESHIKRHILQPRDTPGFLFFFVVILIILIILIIIKLALEELFGTNDDILVS